jgi:hypothetical protein
MMKSSTCSFSLGKLNKCIQALTISKDLRQMLKYSYKHKPDFRKQKKAQLKKLIPKINKSDIYIKAV